MYKTVHANNMLKNPPLKVDNTDLNFLYWVSDWFNLHNYFYHFRMKLTDVLLDYFNCKMFYLITLLENEMFSYIYLVN